MSDEHDQLCPKCGAPEGVPIVYGFPSPEMWKAAEEGQVALGGCVISPDNPSWRCKACGAKWRRVSRHL